MTGAAEGVANRVGYGMGRTVGLPTGSSMERDAEIWVKRVMLRVRLGRR